MVQTNPGFVVSARINPRRLIECFSRRRTNGDTGTEMRRNARRCLPHNVALVLLDGACVRANDNWRALLLPPNQRLGGIRQPKT